MIKDKEKIKIANRVGFVTVIYNILLAIIKIVIGTIGKSSAIIADGFHTLSDIVSTFIAVLGVRLSAKKDDKEHPYGHEKLEAVSGKLLALILIGTGIIIGFEAIKTIISGDIQKPKTIALFAAVLSIVIKEWMYRYTIKAADKIESNSLRSDAWHHRTDAFSSLGTLIGVGGAIFGLTILDPLASLVVSLLIVKVGIEIFVDSVKGLIDTSADNEIEERIKQLVVNVKGVEKLDLLRTRVHGNRINVDIEVVMDKELSLEKSHNIAEEVREVLLVSLPKIKFCMVHVNPSI
jgi:cation diffusion facilitator family transporter